MSENFKVKIDLRNGFIELEGSEEFVQRNLDFFKKEMDGMIQKDDFKKEIIDPKRPIHKKKFQKKKKSFSLSPLRFGVEETSERPSLKGFFEEKGDPKSNPDIISIIAYYIEKYSDLEEFEEGHAFYAYKHLRKPLPKHFRQAFLDTKNKKLWIENGQSEHTWKISYEGELHVENELKENEKVGNN